MDPDATAAAAPAPVDAAGLQRSDSARSDLFDALALHHATTAAALGALPPPPPPLAAAHAAAGDDDARD